jgi:hypothetical protein
MPRSRTAQAIRGVAVKQERSGSTFERCIWGLDPYEPGTRQARSVRCRQVMPLDGHDEKHASKLDFDA